MSADPSERYFCPCPRGLEAVLAGELSGLGATDVAPAEGGVGFAGDFDLACRVNLWSRVASRVLWRVGGFPYRNEDDVYKGARAIDWPRHFHVDRSLRVNVSATRSPLKSLDFATLRIKDAVCDRFRDEQGRRPSVDTARPEVRIYCYLTAGDATLYLDTSGEALFKRGLRRAAGEAPLRENLAAGILMLTGWQPGTALLDPMCGSGTFLLEAAQMALGLPPGGGRNFGFENLSRFDPERWRALRDAPRPAPARPPRIYGSDIDPRAVEVARANLAAADLAGAVRLRRADLLELKAPEESGVLVANPPYGVRLDETDRLAAFYPRLGDALKQRFAGWNAWFLTGDQGLAKGIRLSPSRRIPLYNGALECRLLEYRVVAGSLRRKPPAGAPQEGPASPRSQ